MGPLLALALAASSTALPPALPPLTADERAALQVEWRNWDVTGLTAYRDGDLGAARKAHERALAVARRLYPTGDFPDGHADLTVSLNNLAVALSAQGMKAGAEELYREALDIRRRLYPKQDHLLVARSLNNLGSVLAARGKAAEAEPLFREALEMHLRLFPNRDHPQVTRSLDNLASSLAAQEKLTEAEQLYRRARAMNERLYPKSDHEDVIVNLDNLADLLKHRGKVLDAEELYREALAVGRRVYPKQDHPDVARCLNNLAVVLDDRGKSVEAERLNREALAMVRRVYPKQDHTDVARGLTDLANVLKGRGKASDAEELYREALGMVRRVHQNQDHADVARCLNNLAMVLRNRGEVADAVAMHLEALDMLRRLYPKQDHPHVAAGLSNLARTLEAQGKVADAEPLLREEVEMVRRLYPKQDHPEVAGSVVGLAIALLMQGKATEAEPLFREALGMSRRLVADSGRRLAEGDALTLSASLPYYRDGYLSNARALGSKPAEVYAEVFADRGAVSRVSEQKQLQARASAADPTAAKLLTELAAARIRRAELLHAPATRNKAAVEKREEELKGFETVIAVKSNELSARFTPVARIERLNAATPAELQKALPDGAVAVDFLKWVHFEYDPKNPGKVGAKVAFKYLAFVVTRDGIKWLDLGPADKIEKAVAVWREAITDAKNPVPADLGATVRELVWAPVRKELPDGTKEVYLSPDAALCRLPWVALPGDKPGTVLLEDEFAVAVIPHAPFLLDHLWERDKSIREKAGTLVVGGVDFDATPASKPDPKAVQPELLLDAKAKPWPALAGSKLEADGLLALAKAQKRDATSLSAADATPAAVLKALPQAKHAHFATHGFFADAKFRSAFQLDEKDYRISLTGERIGRAANSPLVMTGLVLAGANDPNTPGRGVVTGESLVDLDLSGLELAVLSACETGLGDVAGGEGTFGLQRAFHTAGTRNVVASLWSVSDAATAALMGEFYRQLWEKNLTPMQALKQAQLKVLRTDRKDLGTLALRGPEASGVKDTVEANFPPGKDATRNHPALWAAFTLSGPGK